MKGIKAVLLIVVLIVILGGAALLYPKLAESYEPRDVPSVEAPAPASVPETPTAIAEETVPDFTVLDMDGNEVSLSEFFGKPLIINFWATWCGPCRSELPAFDAAAARYSGEISFLMVNLTDGGSETVEGVKGFVSDNGFSFPVYFDTAFSAANAYGISSIPLTVFVNADGSLMDYCIGSMSEEILAGYIDTLLKK